MNKDLKLAEPDKVFEFEDKTQISDFKFNSQVVKVFDDMVTRSVPYYDEMQRMICELAKDFANEGSTVYDIGCSTATTFCLLDEALKDRAVKFHGFDNSQDMLDKARDKLNKLGVTREVELEYADLNKGVRLENASFVTFILTLQFLRPLYREKIIKQIFEGMNENGALVLVEKVTSEDTIFNRLFINHYYDYKRRNGYSDMEIANKREALENVLIPYRMEENFELLYGAGFSKVEVFFKWYNFCAIIAIK